MPVQVVCFVSKNFLSEHVVAAVLMGSLRINDVSRILPSYVNFKDEGCLL